MISSVRGEVAEVGEDRVYVAVAGGTFVLELLVPASDVPFWRESLGESAYLHTRFYLEGDSSGGNSEPRLLGFRSVVDRRFFELFITVKGIGPRKALRALTVPCADIAAAIESKDARFLSGLPGIGKRTAEQVIAELSGKASDFAVGGRASGGGSGAVAPGGGGRRPAAQEDAILTLLALGDRRSEAEALLDRVLAESPGLTTADQLVRAMLLLRGVRS